MISSHPKPRILVVTVVHHPEDARIRHRQIEALLAAGWHVTYAAPFAGFDVPMRADEQLQCVDLQRSHGRRRIGALWAARKFMRRESRRHDVVLVHDPELLISLAGLGLRNVVWDVHEDTAAAIETKEWLPSFLRKPAQSAVRWLETWAERRFSLLLAEYEYQDRFSKHHPVIPNSVRPAANRIAPGRDRVAYLGSITEERGAAMLVQVGAALREATEGNCTLHVIGPANDQFSKNALQAAAARGDLIWHGFLPQNSALPMLDGALAGVSFLQDVANYRHSMPTKVLEYMAHGIPVVATELPLVKRLLSESEAGFSVGFDAASDAVDSILRLYRDSILAAEMGQRGHAYIDQKYNWNVSAGDFINELEAIARR